MEIFHTINQNKKNTGTVLLIHLQQLVLPLNSHSDSLPVFFEHLHLTSQSLMNLNILKQVGTPD